MAGTAAIKRIEHRRALPCPHGLTSLLLQVLLLNGHHLHARIAQPIVTSVVILIILARAIHHSHTLKLQDLVPLRQPRNARGPARVLVRARRGLLMAQGDV